ncbi:hypothetical protein ACFQDF_17655 [Ectobacillus funiculus]|uniref:Uncharacterized protein n=1 Tax=Ectobacillus funiculus TaxID=137993 RepID=A0ABV5WHE3_9BACI
MKEAAPKVVLTIIWDSLLHVYISWLIRCIDKFLFKKAKHSDEITYKYVKGYFFITGVSFFVYRIYVKLTQHGIIGSSVPEL